MLAYSVSGKYKLYNAKSAPGCVCAHFSLSADIYTCQKHVGKKSKTDGMIEYANLKKNDHRAYQNNAYHYYMHVSFETFLIHIRFVQKEIQMHLHFFNSVSKVTKRLVEQKMSQ